MCQYIPRGRGDLDGMNHLSTRHWGQYGKTILLLVGTWLISVALTHFGTSPLVAAPSLEIAILNSSENAAYQEAITGFKATAPSGAIYTQYDLQGDLELGKKFARKVRASDASLVLAVGLKAALAAKLEIIDTPIVYMMILDPLKHRLMGPNMAGTMLEVPVERQLKLIRTFLPTIKRLGTLYDPKKSAAKIKDAQQQAAALGIDLNALK